MLAAAAAAAARLAAAAVSKGPAWRILGAAGQQLQYSSDIPLVGSAAGAGGAGQLVHKEPETPLLRSIRNRILVTCDQLLCAACQTIQQKPYQPQH
jgi:hypothetical protein